MASDQITVQELAVLREQNVDFFLLDVRNEDEYQTFNLGGCLIPLVELSNRMDEIPTDKLVVIYCHSGYRSQVAMQMLNMSGINQIKNLIGGVLAWRAHLSS